MRCPKCSFDNSSKADACSQCGSKLDGSVVTGWAAPSRASDATITELPPDELGRGATVSEGQTVRSLDELKAGSLLGDRYEIVRILGQGGMGAVFQARDRELDRMVALKVIRPELANRENIVARFKQEIVLARQITHKNVVRIFDLGLAGGVKFITMEFVDGSDLHAMRDQYAEFPLKEKVRIVHQITLALEAAHAEGVMHRDLKPHNVMIENKTGRIVVMDFGIARSMEDAGATSTGTLIGTPAYMSPEQARGDKLDARSDLFSLGIVFYELLTGKAPYEAETTIGLLLKRVQDIPIAPVDLDQSIPQALNDIVLKCMVVDRDARYQTAEQVRRDLEGWQGSPETFRTIVDGVTAAVAPIVALPAPPPAPVLELVRRAPAWKRIGVPVAAALSLAAAGFYFRDSFTAAKPTPEVPVTVMISDFTNRTGDTLFDGTLEPMVRIALEDAGFITAYDRTQLRSLGVRLEKGTETLDEATARRIAMNQGIGVIFSATLERQGGGYKLTAKASETVTGNTIATVDGSASGKQAVLNSTTKVALSVRRALGDSSESAQRFAMETLSATSLEAVHEYAKAMDALSNGRLEGAQQSFARATEIDPTFGLAYAGTSVAYRNQGRLEEAEKYVRMAFQHLDRMTERERYRTRGHFYFMTGEHQKCAEEYGALITRFPSDAAARNNLALCSTHLRNMPKAIDEMRRVLAIFPKRALYRLNLALYLTYGGDFVQAEREARAVQELNATIPQGFIAVALAQLGQGQIARAAETYERLRKVSPSDADGGLADLAVYEGRYPDAMRTLESAAAADLAANRAEKAAGKLIALADVQILRGQKSAAQAAAEKALGVSKTTRTRFMAARVLIESGNAAKSKALAAGLASELQAESQAYAKLLDGEALLLAGDARGAVKTFTDANRLVDTWLGRFDLGRAYLAAGAFTEADSEFDRCLKRRGEATALFLDEVPTFGYFPSVHYYIGRVREGLKSSGFADSYRAYLAIRGKSSEDQLAADARRRAGR